MAKTEITAQEIVKRVEAHQKATQTLRDRMETDFGLLTLQPYQVSTKEGDYENMTTNDAFAQAMKLIEMLATSTIKFSVPLVKAENKKGAKAEREKGANTERLVYGLLDMADKRRENFQLQTVVNALSLHSILRGWIAQRYLEWKDDDGQVVSDYAVWDSLNTYWGLGAKGLAWACLEITKELSQATDEYNTSEGKLIPDDKGNVTLYDFYDDENEYISTKSEIVDSHPHGRKYPPVSIFPVGSMPLVQSEKYSDTIQYVGESFFAGSRNLFEVRSRILSYLLTITAQAAHNPMIGYYDGETPPAMPSNPYTQGTVIWLKRTDKNEEIKPLFTPVMPKDAFALLGDIDRQLSMVGMPPILYGGDTQSTSTASGLNLLSYYAKTVLLPRKQAIEKSLEWFAAEAVKQFKDNDYSIEALQGTDRVSKDFCVAVKAEDIIDNRRIKCELVPDTLQDMAQKSGIAKVMVEAGIWSKQHSRDFMSVEDTDAEQEAVYREEAEQIPAVKMRMLADALHEDNPKLSDILVNEIERAEAQKQPEQPMGENPAGVPTPPLIAANTAVAGQPLQIPPDIMEKMRLAKMGMVRG